MERGQKGSDSSLALRTVQLQGENIVIQQPPLVPKYVTTRQRSVQHQGCGQLHNGPSTRKNRIEDYYPAMGKLCPSSSIQSRK